MPRATNLIVPARHFSIGRPESWPLTPDTARVLARVARSSIPVLCLGSSGTAFGRIATSVHRSSDRARLERVDLRGDGPGALLGLARGTVASYLTLALDGIEALDHDGQDVLLSYLEGSAPRLLCGTRASLAELAASFREDLLAQLTMVTVEAPALDKRADEIPRLAAERLSALSLELDVEPPPRLTPAAASALAAHDWPGDVTEFDAVLLTALLREDASAPIAAEDLGWRRRATPERLPDAVIAPRRGLSPQPPPAPRPPEASPPTAGTEPLDTLESVAVELAHQLKNPLVTVKTFVSNASRLDEEEMARFREIALEGIDRIDGPLDQILDFSRLSASTHEVLEVSTQLTQNLDAFAPQLEAKEIEIQGLPPTHLSARGARTNLDFALSTLCRQVADTIEPRSTLTISRPAAELVLLHYRESGAATHLRGATGDPDSSFPLALLLVRGALTRMGGGLRTSHAQNEVTIELSFTAA